MWGQNVRVIHICENIKTPAEFCFVCGNFDSGTISELQKTALILIMTNTS